MEPMSFIWNDGGRSASGFVGLAGDCVTRSIAIATGRAYRDVYDRLGEGSGHSPRDGVNTHAAANYLKQLGWTRHQGPRLSVPVSFLPKGVYIVSMSHWRKSRHFTTVIDHVVHDTWNPFEDEYALDAFWTPPPNQQATTLPTATCTFRRTEQEVLTQQAFEKILSRLRALDRTATNDASTEGEKHNALRMMQDLMLRHNLTRADIVDEDNIEHVRFARMACPVNGARICIWEGALSIYVTTYIFPTTQVYCSRSRNRSLFWFYGPKVDVENAIELFKELLLTIATAAKLQFGGYSRGSGASYAEGYVAGLPRWNCEGKESSTAASCERSPVEGDSSDLDRSRALIQQRTLAVTDAARQWLDIECGIQLQRSRRAGRYERDPLAEHLGRQDGATHEIKPGRRALRLTDGRSSKT